MKEKERDSDRYIRVGTTLYKIVRRPLMSGDFIEERRVWNYETLRQNNLSEFPESDFFREHDIQYQ